MPRGQHGLNPDGPVRVRPRRGMFGLVRPVDPDGPGREGPKLKGAYSKSVSYYYIMSLGGRRKARGAPHKPGDPPHRPSAPRSTQDDESDPLPPSAPLPDGCQRHQPSPDRTQTTCSCRNTFLFTGILARATSQNSSSPARGPCRTDPPLQSPSRMSNHARCRRARPSRTVTNATSPAKKISFNVHRIQLNFYLISLPKNSI